MNRILKLRRGMTLVEILVVVAIIGILAGLVTINLTSTRAKARDKKRIADVESIAQALTLYYSANRQYPKVNANALLESFIMDDSSTAPNNAYTLLSTFTTRYLQSKPSSPKQGLPTDSNTYRYQTTGTHYQVQTDLEVTSACGATAITADYTTGYRTITSRCVYQVGE